MDRLERMTEPSLSGRCLCGAVRFEIDTAAHGAGYCHCTRCQRRTGVASSASAWIDGNGFRIVSGDDQSTPGAIPTAARRRPSVASAGRTCSAAIPTIRR